MTWRAENVDDAAVGLRAVMVQRPLASFQASLSRARAHMDDAAALAHVTGGRVPHHAGALARIVEGLDQRLDDRAVAARRALLAFGTMERRSALAMALIRSRPLMRCAAQSAEISSHDMPHTFSV